MKPSPKARPLLPASVLLSALLVWAGCLFEGGDGEKRPPSPAAPSATALDYAVTLDSGAWEGEGIPAAPSGGFRVTVRLLRWPAGKPRLFHLPPFYADNPSLPLNAAGFPAPEAFDAEGRSLGLGRDTAAGPGFGPLRLYPPEAVEWRYRLRYRRAGGDSESDLPGLPGLPFPNLLPGVSPFDGAYLFILPRMGESFADHWREPVDIGLRFAVPAGSLVGQDPEARLRNNYELLFVRGAMDPAETSRFAVGNTAVTTYRMARDSVSLPRMNALLTRCLAFARDSFPPLPLRRFDVGVSPVFAGIEGRQGYWIQSAYAFSAEVHLHEIVHTWVGVHLGEREDPWWKEGMTNYLGRLLAVQGGLLPDSIFRRAMTIPLDSFPAVREVPLRDPRIRTRLFLPLDTLFASPPDTANYPVLVYEKGAQASMILDRYILENSKGRNSLYGLVRLLYERHRPAFSAADFERAVAEAARVPRAEAEALVRGLLQGAGPFPADSLQRTVEALASRGRLRAAGGFPLARGPGDSPLLWRSAPLEAGCLHRSLGPLKAGAAKY